MEWSRKARARAKPIKGITDEYSVSVTGPRRTNLKPTLVRNLVNKGIFDGVEPSSFRANLIDEIEHVLTQTPSGACDQHSLLAITIITTDKPRSRSCPPCPPKIRHPAALPLPLPLTLLQYSTLL